MTTVDQQVSEHQPRWPRALLAVAVGLTLVALAGAVWFGVAWIRAGNDEALDRAKVRDRVDEDARTAIATFHTLDYRAVDRGMDSWANASTGSLRDEVVGSRDSRKKAIEAAKSTTTAVVLASAVTELNEFEGQATVIAAVKMTVTLDGKPPEDKYVRVQGALQRTAEGWKLSGIGQVNVARTG